METPIGTSHSHAPSLGYSPCSAGGLASAPGSVGALAFASPAAGTPASTASGDILYGSYTTVNDVLADCEQLWGELLRESGHPVTSLQMRLKDKEAKLNFAKLLRRKLLAAYPDLATRKELKIPKALSHSLFMLAVCNLPAFLSLTCPSLLVQTCVGGVKHHSKHAG